jgi:hypothetical protein
MIKSCYTFGVVRESPTLTTHYPGPVPFLRWRFEIIPKLTSARANQSEGFPTLAEHTALKDIVPQNTNAKLAVLFSTALSQLENADFSST